uniref:Neugrin n=1 Tax=Chelydra serpentina TaxID=8475 RepID=A0A8C3SMM4_CHESE
MGEVVRLAAQHWSLGRAGPGPSPQCRLPGEGDTDSWSGGARCGWDGGAALAGIESVSVVFCPGRYLRQAFPEEWPVARLAQGFCVSTDVIQRVLRSKFSPSLERRMKQDAKVLGKQGSREQQAGPDWRAELGAIAAGEAAQQLLPARPKDMPQSGALIAPGGQSSSSKPQRKGQLWRAGERQNRKNSQLEPLQEDGAKPVAGMEATLMRDSSPGGDTEEWDGEVLSEEELVELAADGCDPSPKVVQRGQEYFDSHGNFLYRIPSRLTRGEGETNMQPLPPSGGEQSG